MKTIEPTPMQDAHVRWVPNTKLYVECNLSQSHRSGNGAEAVVSDGKTIQITIETHALTIIRQRHSRRGWCKDCAREVDMVGIETAGFLTRLTQPVLRDCAQVQGWHFSTMADGAALVCLDSLRESIYMASPETSPRGKRNK